jgi:hypothetical protein
LPCTHCTATLLWGMFLQCLLPAAVVVAQKPAKIEWRGRRRGRGCGREETRGRRLIYF